VFAGLVYTIRNLDNQGQTHKLSMYKYIWVSNPIALGSSYIHSNRFILGISDNIDDWNGHLAVCGCFGRVRYPFLLLHITDSWLVYSGLPWE